uniref:SWIM-type domain-containing protein n=1 Tax=Trypanosoma congolense (strain IL3000) TaxID=1068625 RepID=G0UXA2_TRYCI|nr:conserved hypothetical protein [Trypanosoma congolense IL3000]
MSSLPVSAHDLPSILTELSLNEYAAHIASERQRGATVDGEEGTSPTTLEAVLAPLYMLYGKVFNSAVGIALHNAEPIVRYIVDNNSGDSNMRSREHFLNTNGEEAHTSGRCLYVVGAHRILSVFYCPCRAYNYFGIRRQEIWMCKHLLALQIALLLEKRGLSSDCIREKKVSVEKFQEMIQELL